jgi:urea transport system ATP-binding protein
MGASITFGTASLGECTTFGYSREPPAAIRYNFQTTKRLPSRFWGCEAAVSHMRKKFILTAEGVSKSFDGFKAINDLNFYLDEGELRTIIGPNGAGKSTFLDLITGRTRPDSGEIEFKGTPVIKKTEYQIYRMGIGRKFQTPSVYADHTVYENILLGLKGSRGVWSAIFGRVTPVQNDRIYEVLETINLKDKAQVRAGALAHGQKQWLEIGMLIAQDPELMLVDEPAAGMTDEETARTGELLLSLAGKRTIIVIEHDMVFVRQLANKVTVLHQGSILCEGSLDEVQNDERVIEVYLGRKKKHDAAHPEH